MNAEKNMMVLVNAQDEAIGKAEKMKVHREGLLHRAFSILLFNNQGEMLLQKRASSKYHFGGLWSNACCSHPMPDENTLSAAYRRLQEELGIQTQLSRVMSFIYRAEDEMSGLIEHELDHLFVGVFEGQVYPNKEEIDDIRWVNADNLLEQIQKTPQQFSPWFKILMEKISPFDFSKPMALALRA